ncbi:MAG: ATP-dependent helicase [Planctomycetota bacterium]|jgi:DNA helicase-2/ATP-dependent DNA helicase PcrA
MSGYNVKLKAALHPEHPLDPLLADATEAQRRAITHLDGPLLVLAGPGSGKTRVVTRRIAWLIDHGVPPQSVLAITFTNKAAEEMRGRVAALLGTDGLWVSTFHSMGARMLRRSADRIGLDRSFSIFDDDDQARVVRDLLRGMDIDPTRFRPSAVVAAISRLKTDLVPPEKAKGRARDFFGEVVARVYPAYEKRLAESSAVDFDDLLVKCLALLEQSEEVREHYQRRFRFVLVDEYQDTNRVQFLLLKLLAEPEKNLHVTGDPDQSIYRFRGADIRNILDFERDYPEACVVRLEENFRSTKYILMGADALIAVNRDRKPKRLKSTRGEGEAIRLLDARDEEEEGRLVAGVVLAALGRGIPYQDIAIFYRIHALSRSLEKAFIDCGIPYTIVRGTEFYRRAEVMDLLAYLKVLGNPRDSEHLLRILNVPARGIGNTTRERLQGFARGAGIPLLQALLRAEEAPGLAGRSLKSAKALAELFRWLAGMSDATVTELLEEVVRATEFAAHLKRRYPEDHEDRWENVAQLVSSAAEYEEKHPGAGLQGYLEEVSLLTDVDRHDPKSARVPFMTLHTAKGLEFRTVFVVGLEEGLLPHSRSQESQEDLEEERRLLFVGMTRAKDELHLTRARRRFRWGEHGFTKESRFLAEIAPDALFREAEAIGEEAPHYEVDEWAHTDPADALRSGMMVRHSHFGVGRVKSLSGTGPSSRVVVDFLDHGLKKLVLMYARLEPVEDLPW